MSLIREGSTAGLSEAVSGTLSVTGLITATAGLKLGNNVIKASDGASTITLDASNDKVTLLGALRINGNIIENSDGETTITMAADQDVTLASDLAVNGGDITVKAANDVAATITLQSDNSDDAGDDWRITAHTDQTLLIGNDIASAGTFVSHIICTPHATVASSIVDVKGKLKVSGNDIQSSTATAITLSADDATIVGDLTVTGTSSGTMTLGADADGTDRSIVFGHTTLKTIMGIDDSADRFVINTDATFDATILNNDFSIDASGNCYMLGDLEVNGGKITFGNDETIDNETDGTIKLTGDIIQIIGQGLIQPTGSVHAELVINAPASNYDAKVIFQEASASLWYAGSDGTDNTFHIGTGSDVATNTMLKLSTGGDLTITGGITSAGATIATRTSVNNLANDGSIPITATCVNIDANGGARTGIRFAGTGTAGQIIVVNNTGGETLTFHATPGTCLVRGMTTSLDTMEPLGVYMFVSDGSLWNLIGGGSLPNEGLTAS
tara:strand:- start:76 stop:1572 length:1497 start_codon:yes stop_codon:yes gene_type:complete